MQQWLFLRTIMNNLVFVSKQIYELHQTLFGWNSETLATSGQDVPSKAKTDVFQSKETLACMHHLDPSATFSISSSGCQRTIRIDFARRQTLCKFLPTISSFTLHLSFLIIDASISISLCMCTLPASWLSRSCLGANTYHLHNYLTCHLSGSKLQIDQLETPHYHWFCRHVIVIFLPSTAKCLRCLKSLKVQLQQMQKNKNKRFANAPGFHPEFPNFFFHNVMICAALETWHDLETYIFPLV